MPHILIVEDDKALSQGIVLSLKEDNYIFRQCADIASANVALEEREWDLVILDIGLPDGNGLELCRKVRRTKSTPVLFLTANDAEYDEVAGFEAGGDDYITKPFSLAVFRARVKALLRRNAGGTVTTGDLTLNFKDMIFTKEGQDLSLSRTEQRLLRLLVENPGRTLTRDMLLDRVWDMGEFVDENTLSVAVSRLRTKVEDDPKNPYYIQTVYGIGYRWRRDEE
ncbi:MAG: response regulator transcription factor [Bacillota bacterium]|nr:response regulator transcription factor [Bacillota bacterium]